VPRVLLVTSFLPASRDAGGPAQLVFDLIRGRPVGVDLDVLVYAERPKNWPDAELVGVTSSIRFLAFEPIGRLAKASPLRLASVRFPPPTDIDWAAYDLVWLYPEWLYTDFRRIPGRMLISGMDSGTMLFSRLLLRNFAYQPWVSAVKLAQYVLVESMFARKHRVHVVGTRDRDVYRRLAPGADCFYVPYPLGEHLAEPRKPRRDGEIVVGISGGYQRSYMGSFPDRMTEALCRSPALTARVSWYLIGHGWDSVVEQLRRVGYRVRHEVWVPSYLDFLSAIDVQVIPQIVGAGTKCKVLTAIASGVIPLGTKIAYENILEGRQLPTIERATDVPGALGKLALDIAGGWTGGDDWVESARREHDPRSVATDFWARALR
jgi:hypothetical protein